MKRVLIKIGGRVAEDKEVLSSLASEMSALQADFSFFLVHGGGAEVTRISKVFGLEAVFENGVRKTSPEEMDVVDMVLAGKVSKYIVRLLASKGIKSAGLSGADGGIFTGTAAAAGSKTGIVTKTRPELLKTLSNAGYLPVISSVSMDDAGSALNINADEAALAVAESMLVDDLIFISDIPGILKDQKLINRLTPDEIRKEIDSGVISGGMVPKAESSVEALRKGVKTVIIGGYNTEGDLKKLLDGSMGTSITL